MIITATVLKPMMPTSKMIVKASLPRSIELLQGNIVFSCRCLERGGGREIGNHMNPHNHHNYPNQKFIFLLPLCKKILYYILATLRRFYIFSYSGIIIVAIFGAPFNDFYTILYNMINLLSLAGLAALYSPSTPFESPRIEGPSPSIAESILYEAEGRFEARIIEDEIRADLGLPTLIPWNCFGCQPSAGTTPAITYSGDFTIDLNGRIFVYTVSYSATVEPVSGSGSETCQITTICSAQTCSMDFEVKVDISTVFVSGPFENDFARDMAITLAAVEVDGQLQTEETDGPKVVSSFSLESTCGSNETEPIEVTSDLPNDPGDTIEQTLYLSLIHI